MDDGALPAPAAAAPTLASEPSSAGRAGLRKLYERHFHELVRFIQSNFGSGPPDPEDVAQIAFGHYAGLAEPELVENPRAFLFRSARNYIVDQRRRTAVRRRFAEGPDAERIFEGAHELDAERVLWARQRLQIVGATIENMEARQREYFVLNRIHELSFAEIARRKRVSESVVRKLVLRAVLECERAIRAAEGDADDASATPGTERR